MPKRKPSFNTIYISERVQECLRPIARCALTTVVAPMGYGKTTAINWFLAEKTKGGKAVAIRLSIYSEKLPMPARLPQRWFWRSFAARFPPARRRIICSSTIFICCATSAPCASSAASARACPRMRT